MSKKTKQSKHIKQKNIPTMFSDIGGLAKFVIFILPVIIALVFVAAFVMQVNIKNDYVHVNDDLKGVIEKGEKLLRGYETIEKGADIDALKLKANNGDEKAEEEYNLILDTIEKNEDFSYKTLSLILNRADKTELMGRFYMYELTVNGALITSENIDIPEGKIEIKLSEKMEKNKLPLRIIQEGNALGGDRSDSLEKALDVRNGDNKINGIKAEKSGLYSTDIVYVVEAKKGDTIIAEVTTPGLTNYLSKQFPSYDILKPLMKITLNVK